MEITNTFGGGLNVDLSKFITPKDTYLSALNMRPISETVQSTGSLAAIRGNNLELRIPDIYPVYKLRVTTLSNIPINTTITILGQTTPVFGVTSTTTGQDLYNQITGFTDFDIKFFAAYNDTDLIIWAVTNPSFATADPNVTFIGAALSYVAHSGVQYLPAITNLFPIGSTFIRDKYYIFTCNNALANPGGHDPNLPIDPIQLGQIWELVYDYTEPTPTNTTIRLVYHNYLDFTKIHPIPPTATEGRYENELIQRIYWTDNFNRVRTLSVMDSNLMALDPSLVDIQPSIDFSIPILQQVGPGGNLKAGVYQVAYRLKNSGGALTAYSVPSNIVTIAGLGFNDNTILNEDQYRSYVGNAFGTTISKNIKWKITGLDLDYDSIEIVVLKREILTEDPDILFVIEDIIPSDGVYEFIYTGNEFLSTITLDQFTALGSTFTNAKTMAQKDNILFLGNIRNIKSDLDYDTRAYRFDSPNHTKLSDGQGNLTTYTLAQLTSLNDSADAINPDQTIYKYQSDGVTLGGEGPNVKYEFGTILLPLDRYSGFNNVTTGNATTGYKHMNNQTHGNSGTTLGIVQPEITLNVNYADGTFQEYETNQVNQGNKLPYENTLLIGYKRNETYRLGVQFFNKQKNPFFNKWIADIKMPDFTDTNNNAIWLDGTTAFGDVADFRTSYVKDGICYGCELYLKITFTIPAIITGQISGYSITRVDRKKDDMSICGQGVVIPFQTRGGADLEVPQPASRLWSAGNNQYGLMMCPDWLLDPGLYHGYGGIGDRLSIVTGLTESGVYDTAFGLTPGNAYYQQKTYSWNFLGEAPLQVNALQYMPDGGLITDAGNNFYNQSSTGGVRNPADLQSIGSACHWFKTNSNITWNSINTTIKYLADYTRVINNQYGGNTYTARTKNEYILCNHFRPIKTSNNTIIDTPDVFGGDTWVNIFDIQKLYKNWAAIGGMPSGKQSVTTYFPVETRINLPLRYSNYISYNLLLDNGTSASASDDFVYNNVYNNENNIVKFFPKPLFFNQTDEWDNRIIYSNVKINGETSDSWSQFKVDNFHDVEGSYGPINSIITLNGYELYFVQDRGFGRCLINPTIVSGNNDINLPTVLGTGSTIQTSTYIAKDAGSKHQWSVTKSNKSILFVDVQKNRVYRYNGQQLIAETDEVNWTFMNKEILYGITQNDNPLINKGIVTTFDYENGEYLITFLNTNTVPNYTKKTTLVFNELTNKFTSFYSFTPQLYINNNRKYFTAGDINPNQLYSHNVGNIGQFYGVANPVKLKLTMNAYPGFSKVLDNLVWQTEAIEDISYPDDTQNANIFGETWDSIRIYNDYQNTDTIFLDPTITKNIRRVERNWQLQVPRNKVLYSTTQSPNIFTDLGNKTYGERMRDKTFTIELEYSNANQLRFIMHLLTSYFRISYK